MHMKKQGKCNGNPYSRSPVLLVALNFFLGILLTYFFLTNVEWNSTVANIIFPIVVFIVARISCSYSKRTYEKNKRRLISIACIPCYFSSILYFVYYYKVYQENLYSIFWKSVLYFIDNLYSWLFVIIEIVLIGVL